MEKREILSYELHYFSHISRLPVIVAAVSYTHLDVYKRQVYCSEHEWLLREVLRGEWGFDGAVVSDWGAMSSSVASVRAGLDLCMPGPRRDHARALVEAVRSGELEEDCVNEAASHIERLARRAVSYTHLVPDDLKDPIYLAGASEEGAPIEKTGEVEVAIQWNTSYSESVVSFANDIRTIEGGMHMEGFRGALTSVINRCV